MSNRMDKIKTWESLALAAGFSAEKMARSIGKTPKELRQYFASAFGLKLGRWLKQERYAAAARLIAEGMPVKNVAGEVGIKYATHFTRGFHSFYGVTPKRRQKVSASDVPCGANGQKPNLQTGRANKSAK